MKDSILSQTCALIDLHLHLDGSLSINTVRILAQMQGIEIPNQEEELLKVLQIDKNCSSLNEYLEKFDFPCSLLQTKEAISLAVSNLEEELREQGLIYAEIRFAPQLHTRNGLTQAEVVEAAIDGLKRSDFRCNLILCCMRGENNHTQNCETVKVAAQYMGKGVCAIDLAGAEALYATDSFENLFQLTVESKVPFTIHAGEADGAKSIRMAMMFGASRIGHGVRCIEDESLMKQLAANGVTLELCPTSNLHTRIFDSIYDYPLSKLLDAGIRVTINTDTMPVSGVTLQSEFQRMIATFSLTKDQVERLTQNAVDASFADEETKIWMKKQLVNRFSSFI